MRKILALCVLGLSLILVSCGGGEEEVFENEFTDYNVHDELSCTDESCDGDGDKEEVFENEFTDYSVHDDFPCTDEREKAVAFTAENGAPSMWDGEPFIVDVSDKFTNAQELLDLIDDEADRVSSAIGYEVFVAGNIVPLKQVYFKGRSLPGYTLDDLTPPYGYIYMHCCTYHDRAFVQRRLAILSGVYEENPGYFDVGYVERNSRHNVIHELYHVLGFHHANIEGMVQMSRPLDCGALDDVGVCGETITRSTMTDVAKLACIFD